MVTTNSGSSGTPPTQQKLGHYKIVRQIARSNDVVYEAVDPSLNRRIALKELLIPPHLAGQARRERIERFQREAKAIGALNHPNIVTVYEIGQEGDRHYIAMEYLEGPTLREVMNVRGGPMALNEALQVGVQFAEALGYAHSMGIIHRDVKPDNAHLIPPANTVKLTDFGIARMETEPTLTSAGQIFGTPSYMSPEQIAARGLDHRSDIFALGVVLYELIVGRKPFIGDSVVTITYHIMNTPVSIPANIPASVAAVLSRALAKDRDQRYQNMAALAADLRSELLFHESPYHGKSPGATPEGQRLSRDPSIEVPEKPSRVLIGSGDSPTVPKDAAHTRSTLTLALSVLGILIVIALSVWGIVKLTQMLREQSREGYATSRYQQGVVAERSGDYPAAIADLTQALQNAPKGSDVQEMAKKALADTYAAQGDQAIGSGNAAAAQQAYANAVATDSQNAAAHYGLGLTYDQQNDTQDALQEYAAAAKADPFGGTGQMARQKAAAGYMALGNQANSSGNVQAARDDWQQVIAVAPTSPLADQARQDIQQSANVTPPSGSAPASPAAAPSTAPPATSTPPSATAPAAPSGAASPPATTPAAPPSGSGANSTTPSPAPATNTGP